MKRLTQLMDLLAVTADFNSVFHTDCEEQDDPSTQIASDAASVTRAGGAAPTERCVRDPGTPKNESRPTSQLLRSTNPASHVHRQYERRDYLRREFSISPKDFKACAALLASIR